MKKTLKIIGKVLLVLLILLILLLLIVFIYDRIMLKKEKDILNNPIGELVEVDGHKMNVYQKGEGKHTLVFMAGYKTTSPVLNFKALDSLLCNDYKIVVIEKFGYGSSDIVDSERDFDTIVRQDREALEKAGVKGPYILCPHSLSGIEALLWAQEYPDEVEAIVGLDMAFPAAYDNEDFNAQVGQMKLINALSKLGITRLAKINRSTISGDLTDEEFDYFKALARRNVYNITLINETKYVREAAKKISSNEKVNVPLLLFLSNGSGTGNDTEKWRNYTYEYVKDLKNVTTVELDCKHGVHNIKQEQISKDMKDFIEKLDNQ